MKILRILWEILREIPGLFRSLTRVREIPKWVRRGQEKMKEAFRGPFKF